MSKADNKHTSIGAAARAIALVVGFAAAALGCYGAWEYAVKLDGISYLALAAPLVAGASALIPPLAERAWTARQYFKAIVLWIVLIPAAATVFFAATERTHNAKAGVEAERAAAHTAVARAESDLAGAKAAAKTATAAADKVRGHNDKQCGSRCQSIRASETAAKEEVTKAEGAVRKAQGQATAEANLKPPVWLLPAALDLIAFVFVWAGLGSTKRIETAEPIEAKPAAAPKANPTAKRQRKPKAKTERPPLHADAVAELKRFQLIAGGKK